MADETQSGGTRGRLRPVDGKGAQRDSEEFYAEQRIMAEPVFVGARVPRRLDIKLEELRVALRRRGLKVSKADLIALAIENGLPDEVNSELELRYRRLP